MPVFINHGLEEDRSTAAARKYREHTVAQPEQLTDSAPIQIPPSGWAQTVVIFSGGALLLYIVTHVVVPLLSEASGVEPVLYWFLAGGLGVFVPLVIAGYAIVRREPGQDGQPHWKPRLRFRRMNRIDWLWGVGAVSAIGLLSVGIQTALGALPGGVDLHPSFMAFDPVSPGRYWILAAWLPFWILNILGEEFLWRGVILPRQEVAFGRHAWIINACGWLLFHAAFGWQLMLMLLPILIILPYTTQRRQNTWVAVFIHACINGPGFIAVAFGVV